MKFAERSDVKRVDKMPLWSTRDEDEERKAVFLEEQGDDVEDFALDRRGVAFIKAINDDKASGGWSTEMSRVEEFTKRPNDQGLDLGFKRSGKDKRVAVNRGNHLPPCLGEIRRDLVGNCSNEGFRIAARGIGAREKKCGEQNLF